MTDHTATFDAASTDFARLAPRLWDPLGERLAAYAGAGPGDRVLDVCCGSGASALPAARRTGPAGAVDGVDLSTGLLAVARARAGDDLPWLRFTAADATTWTGDAPYDVVQCGYGVFFLPDMDADSRRLAGLLRPGGRFAVLTWRQGSLTEFTGCLVSAVEELRGERLPKPATASAAERLHTPDDLRAWLTALGLREATAEAVEHRVPLDADTSWDLVLGTGLRGMLAGFDSDQVSSVRAGLLERLSAAGVTHFDAGSVLGAGVR